MKIPSIPFILLLTISSFITLLSMDDNSFFNSLPYIISEASLINFVETMPVSSTSKKLTEDTNNEKNNKILESNYNSLKRPISEITITHETTICIKENCNYIADDFTHYLNHLKEDHDLSYSPVRLSKNLTIKEIDKLLNLYRNPSADEFKTIAIPEKTSESNGNNTFKKFLIKAGGSYCSNTNKYIGSYSCPIEECITNHENISSLKDHCKTQHLVNIDKSYSFFCLLCKKYLNEYSSHFNQLHKIKICQACPNNPVIFGSNRQKTHYEIFHKKNLCPSGCNEIFVGYNDLKIHIKQQHPEAIEFLGKNSFNFKTFIMSKENPLKGENPKTKKQKLDQT